MNRRNLIKSLLSIPAVKSIEMLEVSVEDKVIVTVDRDVEITKDLVDQVREALKPHTNVVICPDYIQFKVLKPNTARVCFGSSGKRR